MIFECSHFFVVECNVKMKAQPQGLTSVMSYVRVGCDGGGDILLAHSVFLFILSNLE